MKLHNINYMSRNTMDIVSEVSIVMNEMLQNACAETSMGYDNALQTNNLLKNEDLLKKETGCAMSPDASILDNAIGVTQCCSSNKSVFSDCDEVPAVVQELVSDFKVCLKVVDNLLDFVESSCKIKKSPATNFSVTKFSSQPFHKDLYKHPISSSYPSTIVSVPLNFGCHSTSKSAAFNTEFQFLSDISMSSEDEVLDDSVDILLNQSFVVDSRLSESALNVLELSQDLFNCDVSSITACKKFDAEHTLNRVVLSCNKDQTLKDNRQCSFVSSSEIVQSQCTDYEIEKQIPDNLLLIESSEDENTVYRKSCTKKDKICLVGSSTHSLSSYSGSTSKVTCLQTDNLTNDDILKPVHHVSIYGEKVFTSTPVAPIKTLKNEANISSNAQITATKSNESWFKFVNCALAGDDGFQESSMSNIDQKKQTVEKHAEVDKKESNGNRFQKIICSQVLPFSSNTLLKGAQVSSSTNTNANRESDNFDESLLGINSDSLNKVFEDEFLNSSLTKLSGRNKENKTLVEVQKDSNTQVLINTASGQLIMRDPGLTSKHQIAIWKPSSWKPLARSSCYLNETFEHDLQEEKEVVKPFGYLESNQNTPVTVNSSGFDQDSFSSAMLSNPVSKVDKMPLHSDDGSIAQHGKDEKLCPRKNHKSSFDEETTGGREMPKHVHEIEKRQGVKRGHSPSCRELDAMSSVVPTCSTIDIRSIDRERGANEHVPFAKLHCLEDSEEESNAFPSKRKIPKEDDADMNSHVVPEVAPFNGEWCGRNGVSMVTDQKVPGFTDLNVSDHDENMYEDVNDEGKLNKTESSSDESNSQKSSFGKDGLLDCDSSIVWKASSRIEISSCNGARLSAEKLPPVHPLKTCKRPRRIGLSRCRRVTSLHKHNKPFH